MIFRFKTIAVFCLAAIMYSCNNHPQHDTQQANAASGKDSATSHQSDTIQQPHQPVSADWLLVPGVAAGKTKIDEDADKVYKLLGDPDGGDAAMGKAVYIWFAHHDTTANSVAIYTTRDMGNDPVARIKQIRVTSTSFKTTSGIGPSSSLKDIRAAYTVKDVEHYNDGATPYIVYSASSGIAFEVNEKQQCVAVIIFPAGQDVFGTYLKFRTTNKFIDKDE